MPFLQIKNKLNNDEFISDLNLIMNKTLKSNLMNRINEKLLINEITILNKIKDNLKDDDNRHEVIINNIINISKRRDIYSDSLIMSVKILSDYIKNDNLYQKYLSKKIEKNSLMKYLKLLIIIVKILKYQKL